MLRSAFALAALSLALLPTAAAELDPEGAGDRFRATECVGLVTTGPAMIVRDLQGSDIEIFVGLPLNSLLAAAGLEAKVPGSSDPYTGVGVYVGGPGCEFDDSLF